MGKTSVFDLDPERLNRLLAIGREEADSLEAEGAEPEPRASVPGEEVGSWAGRYKLLGVLGEGGMGVVYLAEQEHPIKRQVALKVIKPGMDSRRVIARFEAERQTLALLDHPNIAHVHDAGTTQSGRPYFVMEHVEGLPITDYCDQYKLSIEERLRLFTLVCQAIHHAHQKGIIHRDIKPSNILVTLQDGQPVPKVIDFGVARALSQPLTQETLFTQQGQLIGTPEYMSPEQIDLAHEGTDVRSDVYSLGVLLYVLLTGVLPLGSETLREGGLEHLRRLVREHDPKTPSTHITSLGEKATQVALDRRTDAKTLARDLHRELEWIPLRAMRKEREQRYQSAAELAQEIRNYLEGTPLIAGPPSRSYRIRKLVRRHRTMVLATVIVGLAIALGSLVSTMMYVRAQVQAQRSRAVSGFLNDTVLQNLDPFRPQGGEVTAISVLNAVSTALEAQFKDAPLLEADVRHRLGDVYRSHAQYGPAIQHLQRALEIRRHELGDRDPLTMTTVDRLVITLQDAGRFHEAEPLILELLAENTRLLGPENWRTLAAKRFLAVNYQALSEYDAAMPLFQEVLSTMRRLSKENEQLPILAMCGIAGNYYFQGHYEEAENWFGKALQLSIPVMGRDHVLTRGITGALGSVYRLQGRYPEAERALMESATSASRIWGEQHWQAIGEAGNLIRLYIAWDKPQEARKRRAELRTDGSRPGSTHYDEKTGVYTVLDATGPGLSISHIFDEFHFAHKRLAGDGAITARIDSVEQSKPFTKAGIMIRNTLEPTSQHASVFIRPSGVLEFQYRDAQRGLAQNREIHVAGLKFPHWIRLTRDGNTFAAQHSSDAVKWEEVRSQDPEQAGPVQIAMNETVHLGLAVASWDPGQPAEARISDVTVRGSIAPTGPFTTSEDISLLPTVSVATENAQATAVDYGNASTSTQSNLNRLRFIDGELSNEDINLLTVRHGRSAGSIRCETATGTYTIVGSGNDIFNKSDEFHFAWKKLTGDGSIMVRVESVEQVNLWTKAGIMIRNTLDADSAHTDVIVTPTGRISFQYRTVAGAATGRTRTAENAITFPHWIRLTRKDDLFMAQHSKDGVEWLDIEGDEPGAPTSVRIAMNPTVYIGPAVTSHAGPVPAEAKLSNMAVTGKVEPPGEFLWSEDIGFQMIMLPKK